MKKYILVNAIVLITLGLSTITFSVFGQNSEFTVPLSDPAKRGKVKAVINFVSITVNGTARKDILVKYSSEEENDGEKNRTND